MSTWAWAPQSLANTCLPALLVACVAKVCEMNAGIAHVLRSPTASSAVVCATSSHDPRLATVEGVIMNGPDGWQLGRDPGSGYLYWSRGEASSWADESVQAAFSRFGLSDISGHTVRRLESSTQPVIDCTIETDGRSTSANLVGLEAAAPLDALPHATESNSSY